MAEYGDDTLSDLNLPTPAGAGRFGGLRPQDWLAMLGGLLGQVPLGKPGTAGYAVRPFQALYPLAGALQERDREARNQQILGGIQKEYGPTMGQSPEFGMAVRLINEGDLKGGMALLLKGVQDRQAIAREDRKTQREGQASLAAGEVQRPVRESAITSLERMPEDAGPTGQGVGTLRPPTAPGAGFEDVTRAPNMTEILDRMKALAGAEGKQDVAYGASKLLAPTLTQMTTTDQGLRPKSKLEGGVVWREDPRRGTLTPTSMAPLTESDRSAIKQREAHIDLYRAQALKAARESPYPLGSPQNPHITYKIQVDPKDQVRKWHEIRAWSRPNPEGPNGVESGTSVRPLGAAPFRPFAPQRDTGGPKETRTTTEKVTGGQQITNWDLLKEMNAGVAPIVARVAEDWKSKGVDFTKPNAVLTLPSGRQVTREQWLAREYLKEHGVEASFRWDGKTFRIVKARTPRVTERLESSRVTAPPSYFPRQQQDSQDEDEED